MARKLNFANMESLRSVQNVLNEAGEAIKDSRRTIVTSSIPDVLGAVTGAGIGGALSFAALYGLGTVGLSAAGITSALATAGTIAGGGMVAGIAVLAAPVAILATAGYGIMNYKRNQKLKQIKEAAYQEAIRKQDAIIRELSNRQTLSEDRIQYLESLLVLLKRAASELHEDLAA